MNPNSLSGWHRSMLLLITAFLLCQQGCFQHRERYNLASFWMDYNTLRAPAIFFEKKFHFPYKAKQVSYFHWQYGVTPGRDLKYVRPDLVGGSEAEQAAIYEGVINAGATEGAMPTNLQPMSMQQPESVEIETKTELDIKTMPSVTPNGGMSVTPPKVKLRPHIQELQIRKNARFSVEIIPPPPAPPAATPEAP